MQYIRYSDIDPARHLACDETLLNMAEEGQIGETLRIYEIIHPTVVLGIQDEYKKAAAVKRCNQNEVDILRRRSGGGTVLLSSGCLLYSVVLNKEKRELEGVEQSYRWIRQTLCKNLSSDEVHISPAGISDLAWNDRKIGGSAQQRKKQHFLHHGTLMYDLDIKLMDRYLGEVRRAPTYRMGRSHLDFVANLPFKRRRLVQALQKTFPPLSLPRTLPEGLTEQIEDLVNERYHRYEWTHRR